MIFWNCVKLDNICTLETLEDCDSYLHFCFLTKTIDFRKTSSGGSTLVEFIFPLELICSAEDIIIRYSEIV